MSKTKTIELPYDVGDRVWLLLEKLDGQWDVVPSRFLKYQYHGSAEVFSFYVNCNAIGNTLEFFRKDLAGTVFTTKEEAEKALKEVETE